MAGRIAPQPLRRAHEIVRVTSGDSRWRRIPFRVNAVQEPPVIPVKGILRPDPLARQAVENAKRSIHRHGESAASVCQNADFYFAQDDNSDILATTALAA